MSFYAAYVLFFCLLLPVFGLPAISIAYLLARCLSCSLAVFLFARYKKIR